MVGSGSIDKPVVVVGAGVMGSAAAWRLAVRGVPVVLLEQFGPGHDRGASHGSSRVFRLTYDTDHHVALGVRALRLWRELESESGLDILNLTGSVDHGSEEMVDSLRQALIRAGRQFELLEPSAASLRWPMMRFETPVLFHPDGGRVNAGVALSAFQRSAAARGTVIRHSTPVERIHFDDSRVEVTTASGERLAARAAVVAAGAWTAHLLPRLGVALRVTEEQPVHFASRVPIGSWPSFLHHFAEGPPVYGLGSVDGVKVGVHGAGPVVDPRHRTREIDPLAVRALREYASRWLPGVDATAPSATTCTYTLTPDHDFVVDRLGPVTVLAGFSGHGFKFAPAIGEMAAELTLDGVPRKEWFSSAR